MKIHLEQIKTNYKYSEFVKHLMNPTQALNRVMTRLENEKFKRYCHEKGFRGDHTTGETDAVEYDIFM